MGLASLILLENLSFACVTLTQSSNQGNQGYSGNQNNVIQGQNTDMKNRHTQQRA